MQQLQETKFKRAISPPTQRAKSVEWDGQFIIGWITIDGVLIKVKVDRETIHRYATGFNDAVTWEIERHRAVIFEKLIPFLIRRTNSYVVL